MQKRNKFHVTTPLTRYLNNKNTMLSYHMLSKGSSSAVHSRCFEGWYGVGSSIVFRHYSGIDSGSSWLGCEVTKVEGKDEVLFRWSVISSSARRQFRFLGLREGKSRGCGEMTVVGDGYAESVSSIRRHKIGVRGEIREGFEESVSINGLRGNLNRESHAQNCEVAGWAHELLHSLSYTEFRKRYDCWTPRMSGKATGRKQGRIFLFPMNPREVSFLLP
jgi:hypothetical protein